MKKEFFLFGVGFNNIKMDEVLEYIIRGLKNDDKKQYVVTPNPEILMIARRQASYKKVLNDAELALPDGIGVLFAGKLLGYPLKERIAGVDLVENLCKEVSKQPIMTGFLGAGPGVAELTAECLQKKYPGLKVGFAKKELSKPEELKNVDLLFVAFGAPKQEIWIAENLNRLPVKLAVGVGGAFDFISGKVPRAPKFIRDLDLEWLFRLIIQPWRIRRQFSLIEFLFYVFLERFKKASFRK